MIDFNRKIKSSNKFRQAAIRFQDSGFYCSAAPGTTEYIEYWDAEADRCINGYTATDGDWISGYNYFYLNYCPIQRIVDKEVTSRDGKKSRKRVKEREFPDFYDYDYHFFIAVQEAEDNGNHLCVLKSRRKGYEQPYSEDVLTPTGFKKMGELQVGDLVMNPGGQPTVILDIVEQGEKDVYEIELQDGRTVRCGENHLWATVNATRGKVHVMRTKDYAKRKLIQGSPGKEYYPYKIPSLNHLKFDEHKIDIDPYVLGVLLGDGCISTSQIFFSSDDQFIVDEMKRRLPDYVVKKTNTPYQYVILSNDRREHKLGRLLKKYNLRVKSGDKYIPNEFKHASVDERFDLVRGLMDTDGSCSNGACTFTNTSEKLIDDLIYVLRSLGIRCKKSKEIAGRIGVDFNNGNFSDTKPHWEVCITTQEDIFKLPRKLEKIRKDREYNFNGIGLKEVRNLGYKEKQRCIVVDHENSLYVTKDFVATHNSFKVGSMLDRNYYLIVGSKSYALASENEFLVKDGIITKAWEYMDFIDEHTAWGKKRQKVDTKLHRRASMVVQDEMGNKVEKGYKSEVIGVSMKNDIDKVRGKAGKLIAIEEGGKFPNLLDMWQIIRPSVEQDGIAHGLIIVFGTGGSDDSDFNGLRDIFYHPEGYNCLQIDNIWDAGAHGNKCGFFVPQYTNVDVRDADGNRIYMDDDGNTDVKSSLEYVLKLREEVVNNATDSRAIDRYIAEMCLTPAEACLELSGNIFPKKELLEHLNYIRTNKSLQNYKQVGDLVWEDGELKWVQKKHGDITKFPLDKDDDTTGSIVIWEHPIKDPPVGLYIGGNDPYDFDEAKNSTSLGATFIYKRFQSFEEYYDIIVAEYTGRPATANEYYENVMKLLMYYNGRLLYENEKKGLFTYFTNKHRDYLLADQPDIIKDIVKNSTVQRSKGIHMPKEIIKFSERLIKDWLNEEYDNGKKNLTKILSEPLLEELIRYNDKGNYDRVRAFQCLMIYKEQLHNLVVKRDLEEVKKDLFNGPLFSMTSGSSYSTKNKSLINI